MDGMTDELQVLSVCLFWFRKLRRGGGGEGRGGRESMTGEGEEEG